MLLLAIGNNKSKQFKIKHQRKILVVKECTLKFEL